MNYDGYNNEEIAYVVAFAVAHENCEEARRLFEDKYGRAAPPVRTIRDWRTRFIQTLSVLPRSHAGDQSKRRVSEEKQAEIVGAFGDDPTTSQRKVAIQCETSLSTVNRVLKKQEIRPWKFTVVQEMKDTDPEKRVDFCNYVLEQNLNAPDWSNNIVFSDEATFHLNGNVNLHNCFYYSNENPHQILEKGMKSQYVTIWAMVSYRHGIIHHVFTGSVNGENYAHLLETVVFPFLRRKRNCIYQQDGAPAHWSLAVRNLLNTHLPNRWIGRDGPIKWPPRSPDLSVNDFWLWGYVRDNVYKLPKCGTLPDLTERICNFLDQIEPQIIRNSFKSFRDRCKKCSEVGGGHIEQLL